MALDRPSQIYLHSSFAKYVKYLRYQQILVLRAPASVNRRPRINTIFMIQTCVGIRRPPSSSTFCCRFSKVAIACKITRFWLCIFVIGCMLRTVWTISAWSLARLILLILFIVVVAIWDLFFLYFFLFLFWFEFCDYNCEIVHRYTVIGSGTSVNVLQTSSGKKAKQKKCNNSSSQDINLNHS